MNDMRWIEDSSYNYIRFFFRNSGHSIVGHRWTGLGISLSDVWTNKSIKNKFQGYHLYGTLGRSAAFVHVSGKRKVSFLSVDISIGWKWCREVSYQIRRLETVGSYAIATAKHGSNIQTAHSVVRDDIRRALGSWQMPCYQTNGCY